jgi:hypothetical protein
MGIKIEDLNKIQKIKGDSVFPLTQNIGGTDRKTLKATTDQLKDFINFENLDILNDLEDEINNKKIDTSLFDRLLRKDGSKSMFGDLQMNNSTVINYSARILKITDNYTLKAEDNSLVILVDKPNLTNDPNNRVEIIINENTLPIGFNIIIIQLADTQIKITKTGSVELWNPDNYFVSRGKFSSINVCVLKQNKIWVVGDLVLT